MSYQVFKVNGVVLEEKEIGESDKVFLVFTQEFGKIEVLGKGIRKIKAKLKSFLQILNHISLEIVKGKNFFIAIDGVLKENFPYPQRNLLTFRSSLYLSFLVNHFLKPEIKEETSFNLFLETLYNIGKGEKVSEALRFFEWNFLKNLGFGMEVLKCPICQKNLNSPKFFFSPQNGGVVCASCFKRNSGIEISSDALKVIRVILLQKRDLYFKIKIEKSLQRELREISKIYLSYFLEKPVFVP